jgi:hypothetical protein
MMNVDTNTKAMESEDDRRTINLKVALVFVGLGLLLALAMFPELFSRISIYDDEGYFLTTIHQFLHHGSLYVHTSGTSYGPFYWSFIGLIFRITGLGPTPFTGRLLVLAFTALSSGLFAATVWRVTRNLPCSILCQVTTFCTLILVAGSEPISPGSTIVLLLSILVYALGSYSVHQRNGLLVVAGIATGALTMTKINIGIFAIVGLGFALIVGNSKYPKWLRSITGAGAALLPFVLMFQRISGSDIATFAFLVGGSMLAMCVVMSVDAVSLDPRGIVAAACGLGTIVFASLLWPLLTGTSPTALVKAVFIRPLQQVNLLASLPPVSIQWFSVLITVLAIVAISTKRIALERVLPAQSSIRYLVLSAAALFVIGQGFQLWFVGASKEFGAWLPSIVLLPALTLVIDVPPKVRLALRFIVPIAILQVLHAYPVAGSQTAWGTVVVFVPGAIALAAGMDRLSMWHVAHPALRGAVVGSFCLVGVLTAGLWPPALWVSYHDLQPLRLPGTRFVRIDPKFGQELRRLTSVVKKNCDAFYSVPGLDTLYIYTGLPTPTGQLANWAGMLTDPEEREVVSELSRLQAAGKRVCIVRNLTSPYYAWNPGGSEASRPIGQYIQQYQRVITKINFGVFYPEYSLSTKGS